MIQSLNATRWCEYSDRSACTPESGVHTPTHVCVLHMHAHTSISSSVVLPTDFPSSCKNSAVFGEINTLVLCGHKHAHSCTRGGETFMRRVDSYFADHQHPFPLNLNQAVTRLGHFTAGVPTHETRQAATCRAIHLLHLQSSECFWWQLCGWGWERGKKATPPIWIFAFQRSFPPVTGILMCV